MKSNSEQKTSSENYTEFYIDYYGNSLKANGVSYKVADVIAISTLAETASGSDVKCYEIELSNHKRGRVRLNPKAANYKAAVRFIANCHERLNLAF